jgi:hypothetical protein
MAESQVGKRQISKDNHYVPQLYLKRWANEGRVWTYRFWCRIPNVRFGGRTRSVPSVNKRTFTRK